MKFQVENRGSIQNIKPTEPHIIISISDPQQGRADIADNAHTVDVLFMEFHDINKAEHDMILFSQDHAVQILNFFKHYWNQIDLVIVHCNAGMSRSPAVAAALTKISNQDDNVWFKTKTPNSLVYRTILETEYE